MSSSTRIPSFSLSLRALLTFPIRICNPPPAAGSVRSCKVTPLIKVSLDDVLNKRHLPPLTLKDFEEWLVFVEGKPQYLYFLLWLKEYESRYAKWLAEFGFSYYPTTSLSFESISLESAAASINNINSGLAVPTSANINYIPSSPSLALFFTRAKKTFFDPTASPSSPYTLPYSALLTLLSSTSSTQSASRPDLVNINEKWKQTSKALFGPESHPHPHPKEFAALANHVRGVLKDSLERFAASACHNVGTRRAWCGLAGGLIITLIMGVLPTLVAFFYAHSRWVRLVGFWGTWLGGTVILSSLHGICMMIYLFGDLRQLRSFELARPAISNPRAIARARPRLRSLFTRTKEEENIKPLVEKKNEAPEKINNHAKESEYRLEKDGGLLEGDMKVDGPVDGNNQIILHHRASQQCIHPLPSSAFPSPPSTDASGPKLGLPILDKNAKAENGNYPGGDEHSDSKTDYVSRALAWQNDQDHGARIDHRFLSPQPLQLSTIISTSEDDSSPTDQPTSVSSVSPLSSVFDLEKEKMLSTANIPIPIHSTSSLQSDANNLNLYTDSSSSSSDHGIVVSPAYQKTSTRYEEDPWMWDSVLGQSNAGRESQTRTQATSRNTSRSRVLSAVGSVVQWAITGISTKKHVNSNQGTIPEAVSITQSDPGTPGTTSPVPGDIQPYTKNDEDTPISIPSFTSASADPTAPAVKTFNSVTDSTQSKPLSYAGTFGVRSWIGGMMHAVEKPSHSRRNSSSRSVSTIRNLKYQSRFGASLIGVDSDADGTRRVSRASRWSRGFGFGTRSVPEESIEESESLDNSSPLMSVAAQAHTCPEEYRLGNGIVTQLHDQSESQAQTIASFYAPPRVSMLIPHTISQQDLITTPIDQYTAAFITREYAAEILPDLESVPRTSLSIRRVSNEQNAVKNSYGVEKGEDMVNIVGSTSTSFDPPAAISRVAPKRSPFFQFEGLPGLQCNEVINTNVSDCPTVPLQVPSPPSSRPVRPRPPKLQLQTSASSTAPAATPSTPTQGRAPSIPPISPALPSSQFSCPVPPRDSTTAVYLGKPVASSTTVPSWHSSPMTPPLPTSKSSRSKLWFDTCPRHPEVEAKIAEAEAALVQAQAQTRIKTQGSDATSAPLPQSPASFSSTSRPSTFHSSPRVLPNTLPDTYIYSSAPGSPVSGTKSWMAKMKHRTLTLARNYADSPPLPTQVNTPSTHAFSTQLSSNLALSDSDTFSSDWRDRLKSVTSVPAFGPLTRVLSPLVSRGQWEIVVRSAAYAFMGAWIWTGVMVSLPAMHPHSF